MEFISSNFACLNLFPLISVLSPKDGDGIANSVDPYQTALGAVWSGSTLFAQAYLSEKLGSLQD